MRILLSLFACAAFACGNSPKPPDGDDDVEPDAPMIDPDGFQSLMEGDWQLAPGEEGYFCVYVTVPRDLFIKAFRPLTPPGTHHTVLTRFANASPPDGVVRCNVGTNGQSMIYGSGVGAPDFAFPDGVGLKLVKGERLLLNLHLYNATDNPLTGRSGTLFKEATAAEVPNLAELVLAGPTITLTVPTGTSTQTGNCSLSSVTDTPVQLFALSQHMHKLGTHMKSTIKRSGSPDIVLQDIPYDFEEQKFHLVSPVVELRPGDTLTTACTFNNTTGSLVRFGESSDDEMCFTDVFYYPAQGASYICSSGLLIATPVLLFKKPFHEGLTSGTITLTFRRWDKPHVRAGGRYRCHPIGVLEVDAIERVPVGSITADDATRAGFASADKLRAYLAELGPLDDEALVWKVALHHGGDGDRVEIALDTALTDEEVLAIRDKLARMDGRKPWTARTFELISQQPRIAASKLAPHLGRETADFKANVRKLKHLGLTQSFEVGYEVSPRGKAYLAAVAALAPAKPKAKAKPKKRRANA